MPNIYKSKMNSLLSHIIRMLLCSTLKAAGKTPLHVSAEVGDDYTAKFFYSIHVNPNIIDNQGEVHHCQPKHHQQPW